MGFSIFPFDRLGSIPQILTLVQDGGYICNSNRVIMMKESSNFIIISIFYIFILRLRNIKISNLLLLINNIGPSNDFAVKQQNSYENFASTSKTK